MFKKKFLYITTFLTAISTSTGYGLPDLFKGTVDATTFLDWFNNAEKYVHIKGLIILDLVPAVFLVIQAVVFFKDSLKFKTFFTVLALLANLVGVFLVVQYANPIASQIAGWTPDKVPPDWISLKDEWLKYIGLYGLLGIVGWLCFIITYFLSERKSKEVIGVSRFLNISTNTLTFLLTFISGLSAARLLDFCFFPIFYQISGATFIEIHRPLDLAIRKAGPIVFTVIFSVYILLATLFFIGKSKQKGWLIICALIFLLGDTFIALQYNRPINDLFLSWTPTTIPNNWTSLRDEWLSYHLYRDLFMILGFTSILLIYFVPKNRVAAKAL